MDKNMKKVFILIAFLATPQLDADFLAELREGLANKGHVGCY